MSKQFCISPIWTGSLSRQTLNHGRRCPPARIIDAPPDALNDRRIPDCSADIVARTESGNRSNDPQQHQPSTETLIATGVRFLFLTAAAYDCAGGLVKNLRIFATLASGVQLELRDCPSGRDLVHALLPQTDEPAKALVIEATDKTDTSFGLWFQAMTLTSRKYRSGRRRRNVCVEGIVRRAALREPMHASETRRTLNGYLASSIADPHGAAPGFIHQAGEHDADTSRVGFAVENESDVKNRFFPRCSLAANV